ncbi:ATPase [Bacterioplanes sanyensis]|uniref:ATPase n=1 Tax=Bacterioplanes sanyensis TaxID=1249553 RepID=A0A222FM31_9GAMM|nr:permease [Bacterioplanes sanyensis]ASP40068.1 ATPase [Bacterioplanes sanyensis]
MTSSSSCCGTKQSVASAPSCSGKAKSQASCDSAASENTASGCCPSTAVPADDGGCCDSEKKARIDWIMWTCLPFVVAGYGGYLAFGHEGMPAWLATMFHTSFEMVNAMWWGILMAAFFVGLLSRVPRELVMSVLGRGGSKRGLVRATAAGLLLDLCNHGILMIAMKLYERGASIGQVMAFLIASPWNSLTLTLILIGLIGLPLTLTFIAGSMVIALISGWIFDRLVDRQVLPANPNQVEFQVLPFWSTLKNSWGGYDWRPKAVAGLFWEGLKDSRMVLRWIVFGIVLIALVRAFVPPEVFSTWFGATVGGLFMTLLVTTILEVCSEGSSPIAADLVNRAGAPGNAFTFLMAGAATDYTEIMSLKDTTRSWKIALFLPLVTVPQVLLIGYLLNLGHL